MESLGDYVLTLIVASIATGILINLCGPGVHQPLIRLLCGVFLTLTALSPFRDYRIPDLSGWNFRNSESAARIIREGEAQAESARSDIIKQELEAYILDKAAQWNPELRINVHLYLGLPESVELTGQMPPEGKEALSRILTEELGIAKENQQWTGGS